METVHPKRRIAVLPDSLANKIAAGEVIQRPDNAVKELLENSLDAEARSVVVVIKDGGISFIQVSDDGVGMDEQDAVASFQRHATSKIATYEELEEIRTFGFRGEALASVAAVARVQMKTRRREEEAAVVVSIDGGGPLRVSRDAREPGTTVTVSNLFYNVPARRKFLKTPSTEFRHVYDAVQRVAISHPEVAVEFVSDGDTIFKLRPATLADRLVDIFGERQCSALIEVGEQTDLLSAAGYIGKPSFAQRSRANQFLFLNSRFIVNRTINHAVFSAYEHLLEKGRFPFFILFVDIDPRRVDVNVHPSKLEAKFDDEQAVYRMINTLVRNVLASGDDVPGLSVRGQGPDVSLQFTPRQHDRGFPSGTATRLVDTSTGEILPFSTPGGHGMASRLLGQDRGDAGASGSPGSDIPEQQFLPHGGLIWQVHNKYILSQIDNGVLVVDQHVAHERVLYEKAVERLNGSTPASQQLLFPYTLTLSAADHSLLNDLLPHFRQLGFQIAPFGKNTMIIDGVPPDARMGDGEKIVTDILGLYREYQREAPMDIRDNVAKSFACRSAVKAGDPLTEQEMRTLLEQLSAATMPYVCPHGRPVMLRIAIDELDRRFGRI